jgi:acyl-CoA thioesterase
MLSPFSHFADTESALLYVFDFACVASARTTHSVATKRDSTSACLAWSETWVRPR